MWNGELGFDPDTADFQDRNFTNIEALGLHVLSGSSPTNPLFNFRQFEVTANVVPEPTSLTLLDLGGLTLLRRRCRA